MVINHTLLFKCVIITRPHSVGHCLTFHLILSMTLLGKCYYFCFTEIESKAFRNKVPKDV